MRCKKHSPDITSTIGVCASCLRERLHPLAAAQAQQVRSGVPSVDRQRHKKPEPNPPPPNFPRSVSPYVNRPTSDCDRLQEKLFFGTPQVSAAACDGGTAASKKRTGGRFWILSNLFRARSNKTGNSSHESCEGQSSSASPPSTASWFSTILPAHRHNHGACDQRRCRGLSPAVTENLSEEVDPQDHRSASGGSSESSPKRHSHTPAANRRSRLGPAGKSLTSMTFCLSPLVRASPNQHWSHKGSAQELGLGGTHHISTAASFCANRSRKLADFGRHGHKAHNR
ncbi:hypothetical protein RJT34_22310 [Clitoria ternatea]|uniref:Uncharacterized protein n=1 Tax=Clitoria ternatea TaxID=43366 RepID=A0AAN9P6Y3_CLITE